MKFFVRIFILTIVILAANGAFQNANASTAVFKIPADRAETFQDIQVSIRGEGRPLLMVPGLNSSGAVWNETCVTLQALGMACHIMQLPGFAGTPSTTKEAAKDKFLATMRDNLLDYIDAKKLQNPIIIGHSLGGEVALQMAIKAPTKLARLIIVDSLPFFPAATAPTATAATAKPMAEGMKAGMMAQPTETYNKGLQANLRGMTLDAKRLETLVKWGLSSDRTTTAQAMYELFTTDLRDDLAKITQPTLVLGAWAAYAQYGSTKESVRKTFTDQYANLKGVQIEMSEAGYHFLMWDDPQWLYAQVKAFITPQIDTTKPKS